MKTIYSETEKQRILFLLQRDGIEKTKNVVKRNKTIYKTAILQSRKRGYSNPHFASDPLYRRHFILSYLEMKRFLSIDE